MSLIDWMKKGRKNGQGRSASARPIQAPAFEQLEPRLLLSADGLMPLVSPLIETQYEYAIVVDLEESWNDSGVRGQGLGVSEEQSDGETVGEFDGQTAEIASNQQLVTSNQSGLSVSELTTAARLSATVQNEILPSPADASEDLTMLHTSDFTLQTLSLDSVQTRGPPTEASTFDSSQNNAFQLENAYQTSLLVSVLSCDTLSISPNFDSSDASSLDDLNLSDSANNQEPALEGVQSLLVSGSFASGAALPQSLTDEAVTPVLEEALRLWSASGLIDDLAGRLAGLEIRITDLPGGQLGQADENVITLDATAAGRGWFIDPTPGEHTEFTESLTESMAASSSSPAFGHIDLLTVLLHEIGHVAGLDHDAGLAVMAETLSHSQRVLLANNFTSSITVLDLVISGASHVTPDLNLSDSSNNGATISIQVNTDGTLNVSGTATGDNGTFSGITNIIGNAAAAITLVSPNLDNVWTLTGINSGTLTAGTLSPISFTNVRNLTGGSSADSFDFQSGGAVTGMIQDGTGTLTVGVAGFVQVSGDYDFVQQSFSGNYSGDVSGTVTGANVLTVGGTSGTGLIGVNAFDNPLGLQGTLSGFGLGVVTDGTHAWHLFQGTIVDPSFVGFGSDLSAGVSNLTVTVNNGSSGTYLNTHPTPISVATGGTAVPLDFTTGVVAASTTFSLTISDFVHLSGIFTFGLGLGTSVDVQTGLNATTGPTVAPALTSLATSDPGSGVWRSTDYSMLYNLSVSAFTIAATDVSVFVGYSSGLTPTGANGTLLSTDVPDDAVGLYASNVDVGLVLMSAKKTGMANFDQLKLSFHALKATASNIEILGIPSLTLSANNVEVRVNSGKAWAGAAATAPRPTVDFVESFTATGYAIQTGGTAISIAFAGPVIGASADNVLFKVSDFVYLSGSLSVNLGLASTVDVRTGLTSTQIAATPTLWTGVPTLASDNGTFGHSSDGSLIYNLPVQSIDIGVSGVDVFVGYTESLTAAAADGEITVAELDAAGAIGVLMDEVDLGMVLMRAAPPVGATYLRNAKLKFIALQGHADLLSLIGVPEVQFDAQGAEVRVNQGKASGPWPSTGAGAVQPVVDFTLSFPDDSWGSTADGDSDPDGYRVATSTSGGVIIPLLFDQQLIAAGAEKVTIGISEFVYLTGSVYVEMGPVISAPMVPGLNNLPPPLATKSIQTMSIGATNVHAFVGFNGPYWVDSASGVNHNGLIDRDGSGNIIAAEVNPDAVGLVIDNLTFGLFLGRPVDKFDTSRYMALKASANSVSLVGIPGLTATANSIQVELNLSTPSVYGLPVLPVINFSGLPGGKFEVKTGAKDGSGDDITVDLNMSTPLIRAQGFVHLNVLDSLYASGSAAFELGPTADVKIKDAVTGLSTTKQVRTLSIGVANANAFIGANGPYWTDTNHNNSVDAGELSSTAIGFSVTDFDAGLLVMSPTGAGQPGPYFGLKASVTSFGLVNMPAGITATGTFDIAINKGPAPTLAVDFVTSFGAPGYVVNTGDATSTVLLDFTAPKIDIKLAGAIAVAGAFDLTGVFFFDMNPGSLKVFADAALAIGPSGDYFAMQAIGVLVINSTGVAADLDVTMSLGTAVSDIALVNPSARVILNTSGIQQTVTIPTKYVSLLSAAAQSRLLTNGSGDKYYAVSAGAPRIDGTFAPAGLYVVVNFSATLRILTFDFVGNFRLVADPSQFQITTDATLNLALNGTDIFRFVVRGDMFINTAGKIAAGIDLEFASGFAFPGNLGFTLSATFKLRLNVSTSPITLPSVGLVEPGFRVIATGTLGIPGLTLTGSFGFTFAPDKFTVNISATANVFGASLGVNGFAGLYYDANPGLAFSIQMTLGGGPNVVVQPVSGVDFTISANFQLVINTSTTARTDLNTGASIAASSFLIGATNVSVNLFGFVLAGDLTIAISSAGLSIPNFSLVLDFFGAFNLNVSGSLGTNGSFSFTASAVITFLDPAVFGFTGTVSVTFSNSGFSGSVSATFGAFGIQVHGDGVFTIEIPSLRVCLSVNISLQITPAFHVHIPLPWPLDDIHFDVPALIISGTWANCFGTLTSAPAIPPPPALATMIGNQLRLNIGVDVGARGSFYPATDESYNLTLVGAGSSTGQKIKVSALGYEQIYDNVTSIIANDTGSGTTFISITPDITVPVSINAGVTVSGSNHFILGGGFATVQGGSNFDWIDAGPGGGTFYGGTGDSKVIDDYGNLTVQVAGYESYTVSDTSLRYQTGTDAKTMTLGGAVGVGHINLYGTNAAFTVAPSWTHQGLSLYGAGASSSVTGTTSNHYTLTNASLTNGAGVTVSLSGISTASLSGYNHFDVSGWTGSGAINGFGGSDRVIASNNANFTLTNTSLARTSGGSFSLTGIELADLTGGASQNTFTVSSWTGTANLNGQGAADIYSVSLVGSGAGTANITDTGGTAGDTLTVNGTAGNDVFTISGTQVVLGAETVNYANLEALTINGLGGNDTFTVNSTSVPTTINGGNNDDTFYVNASSASITLNGENQDDTFYVRALTASALINTGTGTNVVHVGSAALPAAGHVNAVTGKVTINGGGSDTLNVNDTSDTGTNIGQLTSTRLTGLGMGDSSKGIQYTSIEALNISLGSGPDDFTIFSTHAGVTVLNTLGDDDRIAINATSGSTTVNTGDGNDTIHVGSAATVTANSGGTLNAILGALAIHGQGGSSDTVTLDDTADTAVNTGTLTSSLLTGLGTHGVTYTGFETFNLNLGSGGDTLNVQSTLASTLTTLNTGSGSSANTVNLGSNAPATVNAIAGKVIVNGQSSADTINVYDTGDAATNSGVLTGTRLTGLGMGDATQGLEYDAIETLNINLGSGDDTFFIASTHTGLTTLQAGPGHDKIYLATIAGETWIRAEAGDDTIKVNVNDDGTERIVGGVTANGVGAYLDLDGGLGSDDYRVYFAGSPVSASHPVSLINVHDTGGNGNGTDFLEIFGTDDANVTDNFLVRRNFIALVPPTAVGTAGTAERINYDDTLNAGIAIYARAGDDYFAFDDTSAAMTVDGGDGADTFQIGQMFQSERVSTPIVLADTTTAPNGTVAPGDEVTTVHTTRGYLTPGVQAPTTIYGGDGNDQFIIFSNQGPLGLFGEDGDDRFVVRAFALYGSQAVDPNRANTNITAGEGADNVEYSVNAPVAIDGGDGRDTIVVVGTEFSDHIVVTSKGIYGAGLFITYIGIEEIEVHAAEGNDHISIQGTPTGVVTRIFGDLGSDTFDVGGQAGTVVSRDLQGHSGIIDNVIVSDDVTYTGIPVEGVAVDVADNDAPGVVITESGGRTIVAESDYGIGLQIDSYTVVLTAAPLDGRDIYLTVSAPVSSLKDQTAGSSSVQVYTNAANAPAAYTTPGRAIELHFTAANWNQPQTVFVQAVNDAAPEGSRYAFIQHSISKTSSEGYGGLALPNVAAE
ncbi:MAG: LEPR-XLL domain-containing protein, partial [Phycisphaerae bacterium]|nr:LEPR-XLL domain-containing protein [Phycisphaerae bacterium]